MMFYKNCNDNHLNHDFFSTPFLKVKGEFKAKKVDCFVFFFFFNQIPWNTCRTIPVWYISLHVRIATKWRWQSDNCLRLCISHACKIWVFCSAGYEPRHRDKSPFGNSGCHRQLRAVTKCGIANKHRRGRYGNVIRSRLLFRSTI